MKRILFLMLFVGLFCVSPQWKSQTLREPVSSSERSDDGVLVAYPNPTKDFIFLKAKDSSLMIKTVTFYSILGMQVAEMNVNMNSGELRLDRLKPGKYLMRYLLSDGTQKVTQIIKQ